VVAVSSPIGAAPIEQALVAHAAREQVELPASLGTYVVRAHRLTA
jgi:hypothetical protein